MKIIGLTGGIGSGKSTLMRWLQSKGIPCFESDKVGKELLNTELKQKIIDNFGSQLYVTGNLDRKQLAELVFNDTAILKKLNKIVHPAVGNAFKKFKEENKAAPIIIKESAILFEEGIYKKCDSVILVSATQEERISRVMQRDGVSRKAVLQRMTNQWDDEKKRPLADFVIENNSIETAKNQFEAVLTELLTKEKD
ncbi:dephospho-CoA kinase [Flavobacteriaceae bacterium]|nr:dephospho-CoA kinase [Flavobacteriaceae bacterium]